MTIIEELRAAVRDHDDWPTAETRARVVDLARRLVRAVDMRADVIEHMRQHVTPTEQAIAELIGEEP